ncbi:hypothetical protein [Burkholderia pseudomultivorans]|uniref:hypothetical protein n=1 Tax=Burkholderia pseudomultivorans TaxID=1207504 RepID=UPI001E2D69F1|nr:hypothetical protein [Burkholderia pseudomultivorans]
MIGPGKLRIAIDNSCDTQLNQAKFSARCALVKRVIFDAIRGTLALRICRASIRRIDGHAMEVGMNGLRSSAAMLCVGCSIVCGVAHGAGGEDASPCRAANAAPPDRQFMLPDQPGAATNPDTTVRSFSTQGCAGAVLKGEHGTATVNGDKVELRQGTVYVNGISYGAVTPAQTVEYDVARGARTLRVDGEVRTPVR